MKVKPIIEKLNKTNAIAVPCTGVEFGQLKDGKTVELSDDVATEMVSMGLVTMNTKKKTKGDK